MLGWGWSHTTTPLKQRFFSLGDLAESTDWLFQHLVSSSLLDVPTRSRDKLPTDTDLSHKNNTLKCYHWKRITWVLSDRVTGVSSFWPVKTIFSKLLSDAAPTAPSLSTSGWLMALKETPGDRRPSVSKQTCIPPAQTYLTSARICLQQQCKAAPLCNHLSLKDILFLGNATSKGLYAVFVFSIHP